MAINLLEQVQKNLGYPPLQKIDPNTQHVKEDSNTPDEDRFSQAAIPATLTALYKYVQSDEGAEKVLRGDSSTNWVTEIFPDQQPVQTIALYASQYDEDPVRKMNEIAKEAIRIAQEQVKDKGSLKDVKSFFISQKNNILVYLPAELNMGDLLNDDTLDDKTNKMEGPISSFIKNIGETFTNAVSDKDVDQSRQ